MNGVTQKPTHIPDQTTVSIVLTSSKRLSALSNFSRKVITVPFHLMDVRPLSRASVPGYAHNVRTHILHPHHNPAGDDLIRKRKRSLLLRLPVPHLIKAVTNRYRANPSHPMRCIRDGQHHSCMLPTNHSPMPFSCIPKNRRDEDWSDETYVFGQPWFEYQSDQKK